MGGGLLPPIQTDLIVENPLFMLAISATIIVAAILANIFVHYALAYRA
jgi:predicted MFS family arabinose efflux permease